MPQNHPPMPVTLASTSRYRRALLGRLLAEFACVSPDVDEAPEPGELPAHRALRLARLKAEDGARQVPNSIVIGSDQVASLDGQLLRKPGDHATAMRQLTACNGQVVQFYTAVCVIAPAGRDEHTDLTQVVFRETSAALREAYLRAELPYDCAGSFKSEGLGVILMRRIDNEDPTALQGLPLLWLADCLQRFGAALL